MAHEPKDRTFIFGWRSAVLNSNLPSTVKLILLVLSEFANGDGTSCYPSIESIARFAGLVERSVRRALDVAEPLGWFTRKPFGVGNKRGWKVYSYTLTVPASADTRRISEVVGTDRKSAPQPPGSGLSVPVVRTLSPDGPVTKSDDLAITYPKTSEEEDKPSVDGITMLEMQILWKSLAPPLWFPWQNSGPKLRKNLIECRTARPDLFQNEKEFGELLEFVKEIDFFNGTSRKKNGEQFELTPSYLFDPDNFFRIVNGEFHQVGIRDGE